MTDFTVWSPYCSGGSIKEAGGVLLATPTSTQASTCAYASIESKALKNCTASVDLIQAASVNITGGTFFELEGPPAMLLRNALRFHISMGSLYFLHVENDIVQSPCSSILYNATDHAHLRFREKSNQVSFETSKDGSNWDVRCIISSPSFLNSVKLVVGVDVASLGVQPGMAKFDNINLP